MCVRVGLQDLTQKALTLTQKGEGGKDGDVASASQRSFWCLLGHLYVKARLALDTMSESLDLSASTPKVLPTANPKLQGFK